MLQRRLGWEREGRENIRAVALEVREGTAMQLGPARAARQTRLRAFHTAAAPPAPAMTAPEQLEEVQAWLGWAWALEWDNLRKEKAFLLVHDGFPTARRMHLAEATCACGAASPGREHCFWGCPVARAVVAALQAELPPSAAALGRENIWLGRPPLGGNALDQGVWGVVALSAIAAMAKGMTVLSAWARPEAGRPERPPPPPPGRRVAVASSRAVLAFWAGLQDFVCVQRGPAKWVAGVPPAHPFLRRDAGGRFEVRGPGM
jgi:hypothetical protein